VYYCCFLSLSYIGPDKSSYWHKNFVRDDRDLAGSIKRIKIKGTGVRQQSHPENEPDFYKDWVPEETDRASTAADTKVAAATATAAAPPPPAAPEAASSESAFSQQRNLLLSRLALQQMLESAPTACATSRGASNGLTLPTLQPILASEPSIAQQQQEESSRLLLSDSIAPLDTQAHLEAENKRLASLLLLKQAEEQSRTELIRRLQQDSTDMQNELRSLLIRQQQQQALLSAGSSLFSTERPVDFIGQSTLSQTDSSAVAAAAAHAKNPLLADSLLGLSSTRNRVQQQQDQQQQQTRGHVHNIGGLTFLGP